MPLPKFTGAADGWTPFMQMYDWSTRYYGYDDFMNYQRLLDSLKEEALKSVQGLLGNPLNVPLIITKLKQEFGDATKIARHYLEPLKQFPEIKNDRMFDLLELNKALSNAIGLIQTTEAAARLADLTLLDIVVGKLPAPQRVKWARHFVEVLGRQGDVRHFASWLDSECTYLRMARDSGSVPLPTTIQQYKQVNTIAVLANRRNVLCRRGLQSVLN